MPVMFVYFSLFILVPPPPFFFCLFTENNVMPMYTDTCMPAHENASVHAHTDMHTYYRIYEMQNVKTAVYLYILQSQ